MGLSPDGLPSLRSISTNWCIALCGNGFEDKGG
jgi:hypothetical protein